MVDSTTIYRVDENDGQIRTVNYNIDFSTKALTGLQFLDFLLVKKKKKKVQWSKNSLDNFHFLCKKEQEKFSSCDYDLFDEGEPGV